MVKEKLLIKVLMLINSCTDLPSRTRKYHGSTVSKHFIFKWRTYASHRSIQVKRLRCHLRTINIVIVGQLDYC